MRENLAKNFGAKLTTIVILYLLPKTHLLGHLLPPTASSMLACK